MNSGGLKQELKEAITTVFANWPQVKQAKLFGSRAKGNYSQYSDIDIALLGDLSYLDVEAIALELDELPFIYKFDVCSYSLIENEALKKHVDRVGIIIFG